jgi:DNA-binding beta-propeller fold protein YncE
VAATDLPPIANLDDEEGRPLAEEERAVILNRARETRNHFGAFLIIWAVGMWIGYTVAGEKMPWLLTHMALPMSILGGWWLGRLLHMVPWRSLRETGAVWLVPLVPALILIATLFVRGLPARGEDAAGSVDATAAWMRVAVSGLALVGLLVLMGLLIWRNRRWAGALVGLGAIALLFVLNVRASMMLTFVNFDSAVEYLVYAHASPDVKEALAEIQSISERTVGGKNIVVAYDDESSWPFSWYFREYPNARFYGANPDSNSMSAPIILVAPENREKVVPYVQRDYVQRTHIRIWWPDMDYFGMTRERLWDAVTNPQQRERLWQIIMFRRHRDTSDFSRFRDLTQWPARHEFDMWVRKDLANQIWDLNVTPLAAADAGSNPLAQAQDLDVSATQILAGPYSGLPLSAPRAVAVSPDSRRVIADTGNHRVVVLNPDGSERKVFGSFCNLGNPEASGCQDLDGAGPMAVGDGQFNEPWGVAVDAEGQIYVADTWNGRIQLFSPEGQFIRKWGYFNFTDESLSDTQALYGPRGLAVDLNGNLLVADTGNKRIIRYTPEGEFIDQIGGGGVIAGRFDEPTSVAADPSDGSIVVADAWNRRVQRFDSALAYLSEFPVPGWESKEIFHKPNLTVAADGTIYATDPQYYRVFVFGRDGVVQATFGRFGAEANRFALPTGIAADLARSEILVTDADNARVMVFPEAP